ncbi:bifunctional aminotransferase class I/II-fold pyridoxal phosphate-dependent enzyme/GNAT family N-acetyltransferase [Sporocytophaga myxococcoides]|nr:bifunctional aminotransferase class I/II-fold pyridoxal phosphate-dependent enzyme/GNAT family N-acetyltransferase [Sporocytophaga myxococcoides]
MNFGSYSYIGLETDERLKEAAIEAIRKYGIQYPSSRAYVSSTLYVELEDLIRRMFDAPIVLASSLSIGHHGVMPVILEEGDAIIMDQQVHSSVQDAARKMQLNGVHLTIVRHNQLSELKKKIEELGAKYNRIWYMCDGVYSMYGDVAPINELISLADHYKNFYLYVDDAHGMSSFGKNGTGYILSKASLHPKMILCTGMAKGFGTIGAIFVIPDQELALKVRNCSGPLIFSGQQATSILAASIASAKIHLSGEIEVRQKFLAEKISYCHRLLKKYELPDISDPETPIFFIGLGMMSVGFNLVERMIKEGFYVNIAAFPAVPEICTGIRFTVTIHTTLEDIEKLVEALVKHFPLALKEEGRTFKDIQRAFRKVSNFDNNQFIPVVKNEQNYFRVSHTDSINEVSESLWNKLLGHRGIFTHKALQLMERTFQLSDKPEDNWKFHYYFIYDSNNKPIIATFFTEALVKSDMLSPASVSEQIEEKRKHDPYYLTSKALVMGTVISEGDHLYLDKSNNDWRNALMLLLDTVSELSEKVNIGQVLIRDMNANDTEINDFFIHHGFVRYQLPETHVIEDLKWNNKQEFLNRFHKHRKQYLKQRVFKSEDDFNVKVYSGNNDRIALWYQLYRNTAQKSVQLNTFVLPENFFQNIIEDTDWEVIELSYKGDNTTDREIVVAVMFCYKTGNSYCPLYAGLNYDYLDYDIYPQLLWQTILRAKELAVSPINLGFTASQNKKKFGVISYSNVGYLQMKDSYQMALINLMPNEVR